MFLVWEDKDKCIALYPLVCRNPQELRLCIGNSAVVVGAVVAPPIGG